VRLMRGLQGRTYLVTGATSGMGRATSQRLVAEGADVAIAGIEHDAGMALAAEATDRGPGRARYIPCDVRAEAEVEATIATTVAGQYGGRGVRVNCICPGATAGEGMGASWRDPAVANRSIPRIPLARIGEPEDIAGLATYLLSDDASYLTGQIIAADGGAVA